MSLPLVTDPLLAVALLEKGGLALLPVDTIPGLAARADHPAALAALAALKGRLADKPFALVFRDLPQLLDWLPDADSLLDLIQRLLPGPVTAVLPGSAALGAWWPGWAESVGVRLPGPCPCSSLLESLPWPLALTSANRSGAGAPPADLEPEPWLQEGLAFRWPGLSPLNRESTVLDLRQRPPRVLREGALEAAELAARLVGLA